MMNKTLVLVERCVSEAIEDYYDDWVPVFVCEGRARFDALVAEAEATYATAMSNHRATYAEAERAWTAANPQPTRVLEPRPRFPKGTNRKTAPEAVLRQVEGWERRWDAESELVKWSIRRSDAMRTWAKEHPDPPRPPTYRAREVPFLGGAER